MKAQVTSGIVKTAISIAAEVGPEIRISTSPGELRIISVGDDGNSAVVITCRKPALKSLVTTKEGEILYLLSRQVTKRIKTVGKLMTLTHEKGKPVLNIRCGKLGINQPLLKNPDYAHQPVKKYDAECKVAVTLPVKYLSALFDTVSDISDGIILSVDKDGFKIMGKDKSASAALSYKPKELKKFVFKGDPVILRLNADKLSGFLKHADVFAEFKLKNDWPITTKIKLAPGVEAIHMLGPRTKEE
jgi:hypothetical protein